MKGRAAFMLTIVLATSSRRAAAEKDGDVVVTGTRTPERSQRSTVKTDVVTREDAERRGATNVGEALSSQAGVQVNPGAYGYLGNVSAIQIQGFDRERVLVLEDGERVVGDIGGAIDLASIPTADVNRIEIVTGPTSSLYGTSAIGGVVNVITSPPRTMGPSSRARLEGRSYRGLVLQGNSAYRASSTWAQADLSFTRQDGIEKSPDLPDLRLPESSRRMFGLRAGTSLGKGVDLRIRGRWFRDRLDGLESQVAPGLGRYVVDLPVETNRYTLHLINTYELGKRVNLRITLGQQWSVGESGTLRRGSPIGEVRDRTTRMQSIEAVGTIADGARTWVLGSRIEAEHFSQALTKTESLSTGVASSSTREVPPQTLGSGAVYGQLQWKFGDALTVLPGVRGEMHLRYGNTVAPRLAAAYRPSQTVQLRASVGRGFRVPSAKELGFVFDHSSYGYRVIGNGDLRPETSWGLNADVTWQPESRVLLRAGSFVNWIEDLIDIDLGAGTTASNVASYTYRNFGQARTLGGELGAVFRTGPRFRAETVYSYLWTRDDLNDRPLGGRPPHTITSSIVATLMWKLESSMRWRVVSDAFLDESSRTPGYQTIDLRLAREVWPKSQAYAGVLNLLDVHQEPGRLGDTRPPLGRVFYVGLRAEFPSSEEE